MACENCEEKRPFKKWKIEIYTMESPNKKYCLWVSSGFSFFKDYDSKEPFLSWLNSKEKKQIWELYEKEIKYRSKDMLKKLNIELK